MIELQLALQGLTELADPDAARALSELEIGNRMMLASGIGAFVCALYLWSRRENERSEGLPFTILLLAPLIAMVTMAVGDNLAAAFTLVGTLAIVRFRTAIRDPRDTAFVIFSVAAGLASGNFSVEVALIGSTVVGLLVVATKFLDRPEPDPEHARLQLRVVLSPTDAAVEPVVAFLERQGVHALVRESKTDRVAGTHTVTLALFDLDPEDVAATTTGLLELPEVRSAACRPSRSATVRTTDGSA